MAGRGKMTNRPKYGAVVKRDAIIKRKREQSLKEREESGSNNF